MTDEARRPMTAEERARIHAARSRGGLCAACGRELVDGETVWIERLMVRGEYGDVSYWHVPVGAECIAAETVSATCKLEPERCVGCGRGVYYRASSGRRRRTLCSRACGRKVAPSASATRGHRTTGESPVIHDVRASDEPPPWER